MAGSLEVKELKATAMELQCRQLCSPTVLWKFFNVLGSFIWLKTEANRFVPGAPFDFLRCRSNMADRTNAVFIIIICANYEVLLDDLKVRVQFVLTESPSATSVGSKMK